MLEWMTVNVELPGKGTSRHFPVADCLAAGEDEVVATLLSGQEFSVDRLDRHHRLDQLLIAGGLGDPLQFVDGGAFVRAWPLGGRPQGQPGSGVVSSARKLRDLTTRDVDAWLVRLSQELSTETLHRVRACLNRAVERAMARDQVKRNVVELAEVPSGRSGRPSMSLTPEQVDDVLTKTAPDRLHHYVVLSLLTGARTEELRALRWEHVHLQADSGIPPHLQVWRSVRADDDTKTRKSRRTLALPARCVEALRKQRAQQLADRLAAGERWQERGLVFTTSVGTKMLAANVRRALALVPGIDPAAWTPRELRHWFVSVLSDAGVPVE